MKVKDLFDVFDPWTLATIMDVDDNILYNDLIMFLDVGIKDDDSENLLFDESKMRILEKQVLEVNATGENKIEVRVK